MMPNIEIKARCPRFEDARKIALELKTDELGLLHQVDTYYFTKKGRLKLREINDREALLIPYFKDYSKGPMKSTYELLSVRDKDNLKTILDQLLGTEAIVDKKREVFLIANVRVHLDQVENLGNFIELEAVYDDDTEAARNRESRNLQTLMSRFQIDEGDLLDRSYIDYLLLKK